MGSFYFDDVDFDGLTEFNPFNKVVRTYSSPGCGNGIYWIRAVSGSGQSDLKVVQVF